MVFTGEKKRVFLAIAALLVSITCLALLAGCGANEKESIEKCIAESMDAAESAASAEDAPPNLLPGDASKYDGIDVSGVLGAYYAKFSYSVDDVTVDGDRARVQVSADLITLDQCIDMQMTALSDVLSSPVPTNDWTCQANGEYPDLKACVEAYEPLVEEATPKSVSASVDLKKFNGKWEIDTPYRSLGATDAQALIFLLQKES